MLFFPPKSGLLPLRCLVAAAIACCVCAAVAAADASAASGSGPGLSGPIVAPNPGKKRDIPRDIVRIAVDEFRKGVREVPRGSNNSAEIARYRGALVPRPHSGPWCAYFASWVTRRAGAPLGRRGAGIASAAGIRLWAQRTGRWHYIPRPGDVAVYSGHAGIVVAVRGSRTTTIEGNWSDRVSRVYRSRYEAYGFARVAVGDHLAHR